MKIDIKKARDKDEKLIDNGQKAYRTIHDLHRYRYEIPDTISISVQELLDIVAVFDRMFIHDDMRYHEN